MIPDTNITFSPEICNLAVGAVGGAGVVFYAIGRFLAILLAFYAVYRITEIFIAKYKF